MKKILLLTLFVFLYALSPSKKITYQGYISKVTYNKKYLIAGLEDGKIVIKNFKTLKTLTIIKLPNIHDFMGDIIAMPIYSLDISPNDKKLLILSEGEDAKRELFIYNLKTKKLKHIFTTKETLMQARFITENKIFFALLSDEAVLYNLKTRKNIYRHQIGNYVFSTYVLNKNKTLAVFGDESGAIKIVKISNGKKIKEIQGFNKDKTLNLDIKKNLVINGSSDMRVAIYNIKQGNEILTLKAPFLPYGVGLSPDLSKFAIQYDEKNDIAVYNMNKKLLYTLHGHTMALNGLRFLNNNTILSFSPAEILIWKLK